jgi:hypothetical protein
VLFASYSSISFLSVVSASVVFRDNMRCDMLGTPLMGILARFACFVLLFQAFLVKGSPHLNAFEKRASDGQTYLLGVGKGDITG